MALHQSGVWRGNSGNGKRRLDRRFESPVCLRQHHEDALLKTTTSTFRGTRGSKAAPGATFCCASVAGWRGSLRRNPRRAREFEAEGEGMIRRYRELVIVFVILLASLGIFLIYNSVTNISHSGGELDVIMGACCCSLALIMTYNLLVQLRDLSESDQHQQE